MQAVQLVVGRPKKGRKHKGATITQAVALIVVMAFGLMLIGIAFYATDQTLGSINISNSTIVGQAWSYVQEAFNTGFSLSKIVIVLIVVGLAAYAAFRYVWPMVAAMGGAA